MIYKCRVCQRTASKEGKCPCGSKYRPTNTAPAGTFKGKGFYKNDS